MQRIPEPELMDEGAQARAYSEADFAEPHERFVALFSATFPDEPLQGAVLDLGCGPADVTVRFARAHPAVVVHGIDGAEAMLAHGRARIAQAGLSHRVSLARAHLPHERPPLPAYDVVISNSLLHHLPEAPILWRSIARYAKPDAKIFVMDLMRPASMEDVERLVDEHAQGAPEVLRREFH